MQKKQRLNGQAEKFFFIDQIEFLTSLKSL